MQSSPTNTEASISLDPHAWHATRWVGAVAGHATGHDLLTSAEIGADHRKSVTRIYAAACADLAQAMLGGLPSRSSSWERWFTDLRSTARDLSPVRGTPHVVQRALFHGARLEGEHAPWVQQLRRGFSALLAASLPDPVPALIGEDLATFHSVDDAWCAEHSRDEWVDAEMDASELRSPVDLTPLEHSPDTARRYARVETVMWPVARLVPNPLHPRTSLDLGRIQELAASITAHAPQGGILQPLLVTSDGTVVVGHRRLAAARQVGMLEVPVVVRDLLPAQQLELILTENIQHEDLSPVEEARGYRSLVNERYTQAAIARAVGTTTARVASRLVLLELDNHVQDRVHRGELPVGIGPILVMIDDARQQRRLATLAIRRHLTVAQLRRLVDQARGTVVRRRPPMLPTEDEPDGGGLSQTRQSLVDALRAQPCQTFTYGELAAVTEATCCACGMTSLPVVCSACPLVDLLSSVLAQPYGDVR
ncbi:MAG TPA: ParB/RepB/Spo0J family partition protein [Chloroflexota bacterium]